MSRLSEGDLPPAPHPFVRQLQRGGFETADKARCDDLDRVKRLQRSASHPLVSSSEAASLIRSLRQKGIPETVASRRFMRQHRANVAYALQQLIEQDGPMPAFVTVAAAEWELAVDQLPELNPASLLESGLRKPVQRRLPPQPSGWAYMFVDIEFAPTPDRWRPHVHGLASGDYLATIDALRDSAFMRRPGRFSHCRTKIPPVRIEQIREGTLARVGTYTTKSAWFQVELLIDGCRRRGVKRAIPDPYHAQLLCWFNRCSLRDLALRMGLLTTSRGFSPSR